MIHFDLSKEDADLLMRALVEYDAMNKFIRNRGKRERALKVRATVKAALDVVGRQLQIDTAKLNTEEIHTREGIVICPKVS